MHRLSIGLGHLFVHRRGKPVRRRLLTFGPLAAWALGLLGLGSPCLAQDQTEFLRYTPSRGITELVTLLDARDYVERDTILLDRRTAREIGDGRILAKVRDEGHYQNIDLVYSRADGESILFQEEGASAEINWIETVRYVPGRGVLLVRTRYQSTGATGSTDMRETMRIFVFNETGLSNAAEFKLYEIWNPSGFATVEADASGRDVFLTVRSLGSIDLYEVDREKRSITKLGPGSMTRPKPSFDCVQASTLLEVMICFSPGLAALDAVQAELFAKVRSDPAIVASQRKWLKSRGECHDARQSEIRSCLAGRYEARIRELLRAGQGS